MTDLKEKDKTDDVRHIRLHVIGEDKTGVIAAFTNYLFTNNGNIVDLDQAARRGLFKMTAHAEFPAASFDRARMEAELIALGKTVGMAVSFERELADRRRRIVILVTKEAHCLERLQSDYASADSPGEIVGVFGNHPSLRPVAKKAGIPFEDIAGPDQSDNEKRIIDLLDEYRADLVVLAKYMRILSPDVVWRYEQRMINIHHSLLPAFPGASAYRQAFEKGVKLIGCTAHYVTTDLDQGPIINQEAFRVEPHMTMKDIIQKGFETEAICLSKAVRLHLTGNLSIHWGKVYGC